MKNVSRFWNHALSFSMNDLLCMNEIKHCEQKVFFRIRFNVKMQNAALCDINKINRRSTKRLP